jgi:hypothetical protein
MPGAWRLADGSILAGVFPRQIPVGRAVEARKPCYTRPQDVV